MWQINADPIEPLAFDQLDEADRFRVLRRFASLRGDDLDEATSHLRALMVGDQNHLSGDIMRSLTMILLRLEHMRYVRAQSPTPPP